ncbi:lipopolysaccharide ABC transporter permease LptF [Prosthecochloris sp. CIB 2401]|nr:lipopolysaccharide ABC transporter permease LptF [Prosthecochloris sp. CIB 2401]
MVVKNTQKARILAFMKLLDRYILKAHAAPFLFAFLTIIFVFTLQFLTLFIDRFVGKGLDFPVVAELIVLQIAWMVVLAVPMAVLVATLITFGTFTNNSEMTVMRAGGISVYRLIAPVLVAGAIIGLFVERFNNVVLPEANYKSKMLLRDITKAKPSFGLTENAFSTLIQGYSILVRNIERKSGELQDVTIYEGTEEEYGSVVTAKSGTISFSPDAHYLIMTLYDGEMHELLDNGREEYRRMEFERHRFVFASTGFGFERTDGRDVRRGDRELSASQLLDMGREFRAGIVSHSRDAVADLRRELEEMIRAVPQDAYVDASAAGDIAEEVRRNAALERVEVMLAKVDASLDRRHADQKMYNRYMVEFHKKYALSFACVVFVLVGAPLGILARRGGFGIGAGLSLAFFVLYWSLLMVGENLAENNILHPGIAMWMGNTVMLCIGMAALLRVAGRVGGGHR